MKKSIVEAKINKFKKEVDKFADKTQAKIAKTKFRESIDETLMRQNESNFEKESMDRNIE